jgi:hypothetical protein
MQHTCVRALEVHYVDAQFRKPPPSHGWIVIDYPFCSDARISVTRPGYGAGA